MKLYSIGQSLAPCEPGGTPAGPLLLLLSSEEVAQLPDPLAAQPVLRHIPLARDARVCKAEVHRDYLCGTVTTPRQAKDGGRIAFGYLITAGRLVLCDDTGAVQSLVRRMVKEKTSPQGSIGRFCYEFLELLLAKDLHHLEELEDQLARLEERVLGGSLEGLNSQLTELNREAMRWMRFYTQLDDMVCEFQENENNFFSDAEQLLFRLLEKRLGRLLDETKLLREYYVQVREMYQSEIGLQQNQIMKILTIVTTVFMPLSLLAGWYGMNFTGMPELSWQYGYPAVITAGVLIVLVCLWWIKKKKFW